MAIAKTFKEWRRYIEGAQHTIELLTDHKNLVGLQDVGKLTRRQAEYMSILSAYDFDMKHQAGTKNPADGPSRRPDYMEGNGGLFVDEYLPTLKRKLLDAEAQEKNAEATSPVRRVDGLPTASVRAVTRRAAANERAYEDPTHNVIEAIRKAQAICGAELQELKDYTVDKGDVLYRGALYVPKDESIRQELLRIHHDDPLAGHFGSRRTAELLRRKFAWPGIDEDVKDYVSTCAVCQGNTTRRHKPYGQLTSLPVPTKPWQEISMDFITDLPKSRWRGGTYDSILVVCDRLTKLVLYIPTVKTIKAQDLADIFIDEVVHRYGCPLGAVTDRGSVFTSAYWSTFAYRLKLKRNLSTAFHPQTDGLTERQNQSLEFYLRTFTNDTKSDWASWLSAAAFAYNNSRHAVTETSPFRALHGYNACFTTRLRDEVLEGEAVQATERVKQMAEMRERMQQSIRNAQAQQATHYNRKHQALDLAIGQMVMLSTKNLKLKDEPKKKLAPKYIGPFKILERIGKQAYRLALPSHFRVHDVFHVNLLEPYRLRPGYEPPTMPLPELAEEGDATYRVERIVNKRKRGRAMFYEVKWEGWPSNYNTWETYETVKDLQALDEFEAM